MVDTNQTTLYDEYENIPLSEIPKSLVDAAKKEAKQKRLERMLQEDEGAEFKLEKAQEFLEEKDSDISLPITQFDYQKTGQFGGSIPPREDLGGAGLAATFVKKALPFTSKFDLWKTEERGGIVDTTFFHFYTDTISGEDIPLNWEENTGQKLVSKGRGKGQLENTHSGTLLVKVPVRSEFGEADEVLDPESRRYVEGKNMKDFYLHIDNQTYDEIKENIHRLKTVWRGNEQQDIPNPNWQSTPNIPLEIDWKKLGNYDLQAKTNVINSVAGLSESGLSLITKRAVQRVGTVVDILDLALLHGTSWVLEGVGEWALNASINSARDRLESDFHYYSREEDIASIEKYRNMIDAVHTARDWVTDLVPSSAEVLAGKTKYESLKGLGIKIPTLEEYGEGVMSWSEEDIASFIEGKNVSFVEKFFLDYVTGVAFMKVLNYAIFPMVGRGPTAAKNFVAMLKGQKPLNKKMQLLKKQQGWDTAFDIWKKNQSIRPIDMFKETQKKGVGDKELKKLWNQLSARDKLTHERTLNTRLYNDWLKLNESQKAHWSNKAFGSYMNAYFKENGKGLLGYKITSRMMTRQYDVGINIPRYLREELFGERIASFAGVMGQEVFGDWGYLPSALGGVISLNILYNRKFYYRAQGKRLGALATAPLEFGKGMASGFDALIYAVSGKRVISQLAYDNAFTRISTKHPHMLPDDVDDYLRIVEDIRKPGATSAVPSFVMTDVDGNTRMIHEGDAEHKILSDWADQINAITRPEQRARVIQGLELFMQVQNDLTDLAGRIGWTGEASLNPVNKLGASLYEVLDLFTTRAAAENMLERADFGYMAGIALSDAEKVFQARRDKINAIGQILQELADYKGTAAVNARIEDMMGRVKTFVDAELSFVDDTVVELQSLPDVLSKIYNTDFFTELPSTSRIMQQVEINDTIRLMNLSQMARPFAEQRKIVKQAHDKSRQYIQSVLNGYDSNPKMFSWPSRITQFKMKILNSRNRLNLLGDEIYKPVLTLGKDIEIQGPQVDNLFRKFYDIMEEAPEAVAIGRALDPQDSKTLTAVFNEALAPNGDAIRKALKKLYKTDDINIVKSELDKLGIDIKDINNNSELYKWAIDPNSATKAPAVHAIFEKNLVGLKMTGSTLVMADQALRNKTAQLMQLQTGGVPGAAKYAEQLNIYNTLLGDDAGTIPGSLSNIMKINGGEQIFKTYISARTAYSNFIATSKWGKFWQKYEQTIRYDKPIKGTDFEGGLPTDPVFERNVKEMLIEIGDSITTDPDEALDMLLKRFGEPVKVPTTVLDGVQQYETRWMITDRVAAEEFRILTELAIDASLENKYIAKLRKFAYQKAELPEDLKLQFLELMNKGSIYQNIKKFSNGTIVPLGTQGWDRTFTDAGDLHFTIDKAYSLGGADGTKVLKTLGDNVGKPTYSTTDNYTRIFSKRLSAVIANNDEYLKEKAYAERVLMTYENSYKRNAKKLTKKLERKIKSLQDFLVGEGFMPSPVGEALGVNVDKLSAHLLSDGTGKTLKRYKEYLKGNVETISGKKIFPTTDQKTIDADVDEWARILVMHKYANDILQDSGSKRMIESGLLADKGGKKKVLIPNYIASTDGIEKANLAYGPILREELGEEVAEKYMTLATIFSVLEGYGFTAAGTARLGKRVLNIPTNIAIASLLSRAMNLARGIVSPRYVGAELMIRASRKTRSGLVKTILTAHVDPSDVGQTTVINALYDMIVHGNFSEKNAVSINKLFPEAIFQSDLEVVAMDGWRPVISPEPKYKITDEDTAGEPLISREVPEVPSAEEGFRERLMKEFGSMTGFRIAVQNKDPKALERLRKIQSVQQDNTLQREMELLGIK